ncbi:MAG TPA: DUF1592 domain-containing protein, partial [Planctomycetaceae bacterium]|nr:DUF1592 domain-containing protein [Planctomycetaceae bacterium]
SRAEEPSNVENDKPQATGRETPGCFAASTFHEVWIKVGERTCLKCHNADGDASDSQFLLTDASRLPIAERATAFMRNCEAFTRMATLREAGDRARILVKATGGLDHGGGEAVKADSTELRVLEEFVRSLRQKPGGAKPEVLSIADTQSFFDGVEMIADQRLLRRVTLSLAARLPTDSEREAVRASGLPAFEPILTELVREDAFYERLLEGFNDILLTLGYDGNGDDALSYNHFEKTRHWYQKHSLDHLPEKDRQRARYKLADQYREALRREPLELLRYIVKNDRPFTEILTADYTMMSPYTARGYGMYEELEDQFQDPDDPFEFIPTRLPALKARDGKVQPTAEGLYPHAGILSMFQYLRRYPTTETNRNRLRARMYYQHFLGVDVMSLAPRVGDAAAINASFEIPTMQAAECVVCHRTIDPIAGLFQDYYNTEGHYGPRKEGWFSDMFGPGREGADLPEDERWRALQWLGQRTVTDPRFAIAMTEHVYYILMGRKVLLAPDDIADPHFAAQRRAYQAQRELIERAADRFESENFNLKSVFQELVVSSFYRADGLQTAEIHPERRAELDDIGLVRMLGPEQLERKIQAVFGRRWGRLNESFEILYGGIDSQEVTERLTEPSGAIGAIQRIMANDVACKNVSADFALPANERKLFPGIELDVVPGEDDPESEKRIRTAIVHLHQFILGRDDLPTDPEVDQTYRLFAGIVAEAKSRGRFEPIESYFCKSSGQEGPRDADPHYTLRSWRAIVTYLLRQRDFLYE